MGDRRVTIAIPVRNGANYLGEAIESALGQRYPELDIIVVDDGSDDEGRTSAVARGFGERVRLLSQPHRGVAVALNAALAAASGRWFSWLSHDDLFEPDKTARQVEVLEALDRDDVCLFSDLTWIDAAGRITGTQRLDHRILASNPRLAFYDGLINGCTMLASCALLRRSGGFDESYLYTQDYRLWWSLAREASLVHVPHCLVRSRHHPDQGSHRRDALIENAALWDDVLERTGDLEAALVHGSRERFLRRTGAFLRYRSPNRHVSDRAERMARSAAADASVSVVIDVGWDLAAARRTLASVEAQTRAPSEVVLVGAPDILEALGKAGTTEGVCERVLRPTRETRPAVRLRLGLTATQGSYIALLMSPDRFAPEKIATQVARLSEAGQLFSHSAYRSRDAFVATGSFGGRVYPEIVGDCHVEVSTVMVHRALFLSGLLFMDADAPVAASWIEAAARHELLGLEQALSDVDAPRARAEAPALREWLRAAAPHRGHERQLRRLEARLAGLPPAEKRSTESPGESRTPFAVAESSDAAA